MEKEQEQDASTEQCASTLAAATNEDVRQETKTNKDAVAEPCAAASQNPVLPTDEEHADDVERLRGDAIGNTLYSERFVLSTLLELTKIEKDLTENEKFENDLCSLWDMTIEEDVVKLLLEHNVFDLFVQCIEKSNDKRLVEILIGIMGNMCNFADAREMLCADNAAVAFLLELTGCADSLTLLQLMRLLSVVVIHADRTTATRWYKHICACTEFIEHISFILGNSIHETLLRQTLETLNAILAKFALIEPQQLQTESSTESAQPLPYFEELFVNEPLIKASTEALIALLDDDDEEITALPSKINHNLMQIFLNIHSILTQYDDASLECYEPNIAALMECISIILKPLCEATNLTLFSSREQDLLEGISEIVMALKDPFNDRYLTKMIYIWNLLQQEKEKHTQKAAIPNDFEDDALKEDEFNFETSCATVLNCIVRMINTASETQLVGIVELSAPGDIENLQNTLSVHDKERRMKESHTRLTNAIKTFTDAQK